MNGVRHCIFQFTTISLIGLLIGYFAALLLSINMVFAIIALLLIGLLFILSITAKSYTIIPAFFLISLLVITNLYKGDFVFSPVWIVAILFIIFTIIRYRLYLVNDFFSPSLRYEHFLLAFIIFSLFSTFYSIDKVSSVKRALGYLLIYFLFFKVFHRILLIDIGEHSFKQLLRNLNLVFFTIPIASFVLYFIKPDMVYYHFTPYLIRYTGILPNPNTLGVIAFIQTILATTNLLIEDQKRWKVFSGIIFFASLFSLVFSNSRTSFIATAVGLVIIFLYQRGFKKKLLLFFFVGLCLISAFKIFIVSSYTGSTPASFAYLRAEQIGRLERWRVYISNIERSSLFTGYGIGSVRTFAETRGMREEYWERAHNVYIELLVETGITGLALFSIFLIKNFLLIRKTVRLTKADAIANQFSIGSLALYVGLLFHGLGENILISPSNPVWQVFLLLISQVSIISVKDGAGQRKTSDNHLLGGYTSKSHKLRFFESLQTQYSDENHTEY